MGEFIHQHDCWLTREDSINIHFLENVNRSYGQTDERSVDRMTLSEAKERLAEGRHFAAGSMAPKIEAVVAYLERGGGEAIITNPGSVERALAGETGTHIVPD